MLDSDLHDIIITDHFLKGGRIHLPSSNSFLNALSDQQELIQVFSNFINQENVQQCVLSFSFHCVFL